MIGVALRGVAVAARNLFRSAALNLDFTKTQALDPRITFSRASNATVTGPDGTLQYAPHNLLTFSEQFDNAAWLKTGSTITANNAPAPDGARTADALVEDTSTGGHRVDQVVSLLAGTQYTLSFFAKPAPGAEGRFLTVVIGAAASVFTNSPAAVFDLTTGTSTYSSPTWVVSTSVQAADNGYFRVSITTAATLAGGSVTVRTGITNVNDNAFPSFTGDGTAKFFLWGAQLNVGSLQPYYPTTVKNLLGFTQEFDNAAWTKSNSFVQTNLLTWSEQFDNAAWVKTNTTVTANTAIAPDGTLTADTVSRTADGSSTRNTRANFTTNQTGTYTYSQYVKPEGNTDRVVLRLQDNAAVGGHCGFDLVGVGSIFSSTSATGTIEKIGDWYRVSVTVSLSGAFTSVQCLMFLGAYGTSVDPDPVSVWGAQLVQGSTPGDYQRTEGTVRAVMYPAPDGSRTADKLVEDAATGQHRVNQSPSVVVSGTQYTASAYMKAGERTFCAVEIILTTGGVEGLFNLSDGTASFSAYGGAATPTGSITAVGNGWYRCAITFTANGASATIRAAKIYQNSTTQTYTGDGTSGIYIWGAQLSDSASLDPYVYNPGAAPAAAAYYGPRFDYDPVTLAPRGLLIEEQRTNSIRNNTMQGAVVGTPGTLPTNWGATLNGLTQEVVGIGTSNGVSYIDLRLSGTTTSTNTTIVLESATGISAAQNQTWSQSLWLAVVGGSVNNISLLRLIMDERSVGYLTSQNGPDIKSLVTSNLQRFSFAAALTNVATTNIQPLIRLTSSAGATIDITLRIGMPQLELGAFATSVIPTSGAAATRAADVAVMTGANFSNWYRQDEGTLFVEASTLETGTTSGGAFVLNVSDNTSNNLHRLFRQSDTQAVAQTLVSGAPQSTFGFGATWTDTQPRRLAYAYKVNDFAGAVNAGTVLTDTSGTLPAVTQMDVANSSGATQLNGHIRKIAYFPRRLSNAELQGITS